MFNACVIDLKNTSAYNYISVVTLHIKANFSDKTQQIPFKSLKAFCFIETTLWQLHVFQLMHCSFIHEYSAEHAEYIYIFYIAKKKKM